jgi:hypothetical protein
MPIRYLLPRPQMTLPDYQELSREEVFCFRCRNYRLVRSRIHHVDVAGDGSEEGQITTDDDGSADVRIG